MFLLAVCISGSLLHAMEQEVPKDKVKFIAQRDQTVFFQKLENDGRAKVTLDGKNLVICMPTILQPHAQIIPFAGKSTLNRLIIFSALKAHLPQLTRKEINTECALFEQQAHRDDFPSARFFHYKKPDALFPRAICDITLTENGSVLVVYELDNEVYHVKCYRNVGNPAEWCDYQPIHCDRPLLGWVSKPVLLPVQQSFWIDAAQRLVLKGGSKYIALQRFDSLQKICNAKKIPLSVLDADAETIESLAQHPAVPHHFFMVTKEHYREFLIKKVYRFSLENGAIMAKRLIAEQKELKELGISDALCCISPHDGNNTSLILGQTTTQYHEPAPSIKLSLNDLAQHLKKIDAIIAHQAKKQGIKREDFKEFRKNHPYRQNFITHRIARELMSQTKEHR